MVSLTPVSYLTSILASRFLLILRVTFSLRFFGTSPPRFLIDPWQLRCWLPKNSVNNNHASSYSTLSFSTPFLDFSPSVLFHPTTNKTHHWEVRSTLLLDNSSSKNTVCPLIWLDIYRSFLTHSQRCYLFAQPSSTTRFLGKSLAPRSNIAPSSSSFHSTSSWRTRGSLFMIQVERNWRWLATSLLDPINDYRFTTAGVFWFDPLPRYNAAD